MMAGLSESRLGEFSKAGLVLGSGSDSLRLGHAKIMVTFTTGIMSPDADQLGELVTIAHEKGFPVAIHAVEQEAIEAAVRVIQTSRPVREHRVTSTPGDRIEHCSECPPELVNQVRRSGATVVSQPGFIYWQGSEYNDRVAPGLWPHLYPVGELTRAGVPIAFGSDAVSYTHLTLPTNREV